MPKRPQHFDIEKYQWDIEVDNNRDLIKAFISLSRNERHHRGTGKITVREIVEQLKNVEKWWALNRAHKLFREIMAE